MTGGAAPVTHEIMTGDNVSRDRARELSRALARGDFRFRVGPFTARVQTSLPTLRNDILRIYEGYPLADEQALVDFSLRVRPTSIWRRWFRPKVIADTGFANTPFVPLPGDLSILAFEMGLNWLVATTADQYLVFHSGLVAKDGKAVIMPGESGRGKSTLTAGLAYNGWRMFSDEFALLRPETLDVYPYPRPISLKNQSIGVLGARVPADHFSRTYENTPKGTIRYLRPPEESLDQSHRPAEPRLILFPEFNPAAEARVEEAPRIEAFALIRTASVNCDRLGEAAFDAVTSLTERCPVFRMTYKSLDQGMQMVEDLWERYA